MGTVLKVDDINVYYGAIHAIKGISFQVDQGEIVTLIGANGAGKSTTLKTVSGLLRSKTGSITFEGTDISNAAPHKLVTHGLAHVPEGRRIFLQMTVEENLEMGAYVKSAWRRSTSCSPGSGSAAARWRGPSPAASSRCWPWAGRSCPAPS